MYYESFGIPPMISGFVRAKENQTDEQRLLYTLLRGYEKSVRPVRNASTPINVRLGITLTHLFDLDEKNQVLTTMVWLDQEWIDELLIWNPAEYNGLAVLRIPCELLWLPDIVLYNNADDYTSGYMKSKAMVQSDGNVFWPPPTKLRSTCRVNITFFPFDTQQCIMKFGSWTYNGFQVTVTNRTAEVDLKNYVKNGEWELLRIEVQRNEVFYSCCVEPFFDVTFYITIRRKVLYYTYNVIFPCMMMSALTLLVFLLPPDSGEKIALGVTVLLAFSVFMLAIAEKLPETSDFIPLIGIYLTVVMTMTSISVIMTVIILNFHFRSPEKYTVPPWVCDVVLNKLAYILCIETDYNKRLRSKAASRCITRSPSQRSRQTQIPDADADYAVIPNSNSIPLKPRTSHGQVSAAAYKATTSDHTSSHSPIISPYLRQSSKLRRQLYAATSINAGSHSPYAADVENHVAAGNRRLHRMTLDPHPAPRRSARSVSKDRLQEEVIRALTLLVARQEEDETLLSIRKQWRQVAQVLDRLLFWIFTTGTVVSTFVLLVIVPKTGDLGIYDPVEDRI
ncbi:neuronal acetylcholine receptor subunit alpha-10-like isoform X2 [Paramacrobiotus metropolitanus]|uniref:neuronal acetylcholine receptor subunit alpha-10-like isoform X2 n=1 Tax=Paramacrobiotus metropolitanus TaxID=2943436 RepID=UPI002445CC19|nr:neuronal acetylcholine receptor subunit alpha-10-like isoform X2 [Paramacrobiotus metropolitanus]